MCLVIDKVLGFRELGAEEMTCLMYLEKDLLEQKYEGMGLVQLSKVVEPFREELKADFLGEE